MPKIIDGFVSLKMINPDMETSFRSPKQDTELVKQNKGKRVK
jgi:hypothetical protein